MPGPLLWPPTIALDSFLVTLAESTSSEGAQRVPGLKRRSPFGSGRDTCMGPAAARMFLSWGGQKRGWDLIP